MKGSGEDQRARGTLSAHLAAMAAETSVGGLGSISTRKCCGHCANERDIDTVKLPHQSRTMDIRIEGLYSMLLLYARSVWPDKKIVSDGGFQHGTVLSSKVKCFGNVLVRGIKYGMSTHHRGKGYCYGFVDGRIPCEIDYLVQISLSSGETKLVALVKRFLAPTDDELVKLAMRNVPWYDSYVLILGYFSLVLLTWTAGQLTLVSRFGK